LLVLTRTTRDLSLPAEADVVVQVQHVLPGLDVLARLREILHQVREELHRLRVAVWAAAVHPIAPLLDFPRGALVFRVGFDPGEDFAVAFALLQLGQQLFSINAREVEEPLVQRGVVVILAVLVGERRAALVQQPWQLRVAAKADARTARRMLREVGRVIRWCFVSGRFHVQLMVDG